MQRPDSEFKVFRRIYDRGGLAVGVVPTIHEGTLINACANYVLHEATCPGNDDKDGWVVLGQEPPSELNAIATAMVSRGLFDGVILDMIRRFLKSYLVERLDDPSILDTLAQWIKQLLKNMNLS